jgi:hypothetical protein
MTISTSDHRLTSVHLQYTSRTFIFKCRYNDRIIHRRHICRYPFIHFISVLPNGVIHLNNTEYIHTGIIRQYWCHSHVYGQKNDLNELLLTWHIVQGYGELINPFMNYSWITQCICNNALPLDVSHVRSDGQIRRAGAVQKGQIVRNGVTHTDDFNVVAIG